MRRHWDWMENPGEFLGKQPTDHFVIPVPSSIVGDEVLFVVPGEVLVLPRKLYSFSLQLTPQRQKPVGHSSYYSHPVCPVADALLCQDEHAQDLTLEGLQFCLGLVELLCVQRVSTHLG